MIHVFAVLAGLGAGIVLGAWLGQRQERSLVAQERARQDLLLDRLASRTPAEFHGLDVLRPATDDPAEFVANEVQDLRHLYDPTGLVHSYESLEVD